MTYYYLEAGEDLVFCAPWFRREGLCLFCYNDQELAMAAAEEKSRHYGYEITLAETEDVTGFLGRMAERGFAGAVLNDLVPVIFCSDPAGQVSFLRMIRDGAGEVRWFERLKDDGTWEAEPELGDLAPTRDQARFDRLMEELVGRKPFRGYSLEWQALTYSPVGSDDLPFIDPQAAKAEGWDLGAARLAAGSSFLPIFTSLDYMEEFVVARGIDPALLQRREIRDLGALTRLAEKRQALILLNPGQHRIDTAAIGRRGEEVALKSFSGRWVSGDGKGFQPAGEAPGRKSPEGEALGGDGPRTLAEEIAARRAAAAAPAGDDEQPARADDRPAAGEAAGEEPFVLPAEIGEVDLDLSRAEVCLMVEREAVERRSLTLPLSYLCSAFRDAETLRWAQGKFRFDFRGWENRSPWRADAVREWLRALDRLFPVLPYFLARAEGGQQQVAAALLGAPAAGGLAALDPRELGAYLEDRCLMILSMGEKYGVDCRQACRDFAAVLDQQLPEDFFLPAADPGDELSAGSR